MSFTGFYPETIDFLWGIRLNNNREWFEAHKADYQRFLWEPMKALAADVEAAFTGIEGLRMRVSRIYRDMRMHPPVPYKETSWMCLRHDGASWLEHPCLFFELTSEGYSYGLLLWNPRAAAMERWRTQLGDRTEEFLQTELFRRHLGTSLLCRRHAALPLYLSALPQARKRAAAGAGVHPHGLYHEQTLKGSIDPSLPIVPSPLCTSGCRGDFSLPFLCFFSIFRCFCDN